MAVERMRALRNEGLGFDRIARQLDSEGIPTRYGAAVARRRRQPHSRRIIHTFRSHNPFPAIQSVFYVCSSA